MQEAKQLSSPPSCCCARQHLPLAQGRRNWAGLPVRWCLRPGMGREEKSLRNKKRSASCFIRYLEAIAAPHPRSTAGESTSEVVLTCALLLRRHNMSVVSCLLQVPWRQLPSVPFHRIPKGPRIGLWNNRAQLTQQI